MALVRCPPLLVFAAGAGAGVGVDVDVALAVASLVKKTTCCYKEAENS